MKSTKFITSLIVLFFMVTSLCSTIQSQSHSNVTGTIIEASTGEALFGANVFLVGTSIGTATDINGKFKIMNVPFGTYTLRVTYIGYLQKDKEIEINSLKTLLVDYELVPDAIEGEEVTITAQREGQLAAINQQLNSDAIKNIVSGDKIEELPEANAAEAVGRLPGVSLQREGGEGNKVVIRGLAPKYNKVQIDGVNMASTDSDDRSTDLSMISPYLLGGIEVTKSAMADQEADQLGGTVNFVTKGAPYSKPIYRFIFEGGYNGLKNTYNDYRIAAQTSQRLFDNKLGVSANVDFENRNRSSNTVSSDYLFLQEDDMAVVNSLNVQDIVRDLDRLGGSLLLDYKTPTTTIVFSNMISRINRTTVSRREISSSLAAGAPSRSQRLDYTESNTTILMNKLKLEQSIGALKLEAGISYSYSKDETPEELGLGGIETNPLAAPIPKTTRPADVPSFMKNDISAIALGELRDSDSFTKEDEFAANLDLEWEYSLSDLVNFKLKSGVKYKHKSREYDYNTIYLNISVDPSNSVNNAILSKWPWMIDYVTTGKFPYEPFIDPDYDPVNFMDGEYSLERVPNLELGKELIHYLQDELGVLWEGSTQPQKFAPNFHTNKRYDYSGTEDYMAYYFMPTISIGKMFTFIPGFRYEHNETNYNGIRGNQMLQVTETMGFVYNDTTVTRTNEFFLPMIHAKFKPVDWLDIRASYTQTLSRPSYTEFIPSWYIYMTGIDFSNPDLKPAKSTNLDLYLSLYDNKIGLLTLGLFSKSIDDLIFGQNEVVLTDTMAVEKYGLSEELTGQKPSKFAGKSIYSFINNKDKVKVKGIEVEWQSNLWYLPGLLKNIVFSINYTYTFSEVRYPRTVPIKEYIQSPFGRREVIVGNADSSFVAPLIQQPNHIFNVTLGYDYKDFSIRGSVQYKSKIFAENDWRSQLRGYSDDLYIFDLAVSQKLPIEGLQVFGNLKNISSSMESDYNNGTGYMLNKEYYGMSGSLGLKYKL